MAITFDNAQALHDCYYYDSTAGTTTSLGVAGGDLFPDTAVVNDAIYFGNHYNVWHDLALNISTPLACTSITLSWEYLDYTNHVAVWTAIPSVVDGTNAFQNSGANTVSFPPPDQWVPYALTGRGTRWRIRCIITALSGLTEGGACTGSKSCKDYAIKVTGTGNRLSTILAADVAGGWGMVSTKNNHYQIISNLFIGDGSTTTDFTVRNGEMLEIGYQPSPFEVICRTGSKFRSFQTFVKSTLTFGVKTGSDITESCYLKLWTWDNGSIANTWAGTTYAYNFLFSRNRGGYNSPQFYGACYFENVILDSLDGSTWIRGGYSAGSWKNVTVSMGVDTYLYFYNNHTTIDNITFSKGKGILCGANATIQNCNFGTDKIFRSGNLDMNVVSKNCTFTDYVTQCLASSTGSTNKTYYTVSLTILDKLGAAVTSPNVRIVDAQSNVLFDDTWTTDLDVLVFQDVNVGGTRTQTQFNPLDVTISAPGYQTYKTVLTLTNLNRSQTISLQPALGYAHS